MKKWDWLAKRIKDQGYKSKKQFADAVGMQQSRITELCKGDPLPRTGKVPRVPIDKIHVFAEKLNLDPSVLLDYNNNRINEIVFESSKSSYPQDRQQRFLDAIETIKEYLTDSSFILTAEQKLAIIQSLSQSKKEQ